jgi:hypothetical protein
MDNFGVLGIGPVPVMKRLVQFDWSRQWKRRVKPHLGEPLVRASVEMGMTHLEPTWTWQDGPHAVGRGRLNKQRVTRDKLSWYQPWGRCHWISFFACAIGVINYPELDWEFVSGDCHTVPVGSQNGEHRVVMDILNFKRMSAVESIAHAQYTPQGAHGPDGLGWAAIFAHYVETVVPRLRELAHRRA